MGLDSGRLAARYGSRLEHIGAADLGEEHPHQRNRDHAIHQHEGRRANAGEVEQHAEQDGKQKAAHAACQPDDARDRSDIGRIVVGDVLEHAGFAESEGDAEDEHQRGEGVDIRADVEGRRPAGGLHRELGLRVRQQKQRHPAHPQHPPGHAVRAEFVGQPAAHRAQHAARQREGRGQ